MSEQSWRELYIELKHRVDTAKESQESILSNLNVIDAKLNAITDKLNKFEVLQTNLTYLEQRVESLEKLRWWGGTLLVGALVLAMLKAILK